MASPCASVSSVTCSSAACVGSLDLAQIRQFQTVADYGEQAIVDVFHAQQDRRAAVAIGKVVVGADRSGGDDCRLVAE